MAAVPFKSAPETPQGQPTARILGGPPSLIANNGAANAESARIRELEQALVTSEAEKTTLRQAFDQELRECKLEKRVNAEVMQMAYRLVSSLIDTLVTVVPAEEIFVDHASAPLGRGANGTVFAGRWRDQTVAVKTGLIAHTEQESEAQRAAAALVIIKECHILAKLDSPYIVRFLAMSLDANQFPRDLVMEQLRPLRGALPLPEVRILAIHISMGLLVMHTHQPIILHRDIKPANFLYDEINRTYKISDLGEARLLRAHSRSQMTNVGTALYQAPEMRVEGEGQTLAVDIFSFGMSLIELALNSPSTLTMTQWANETQREADKVTRLTRVAHINASMGEWLAGMTVPGAASRPDAAACRDFFSALEPVFAERMQVAADVQAAVVPALAPARREEFLLLRLALQRQHAAFEENIRRAVAPLERELRRCTLRSFAVGQLIGASSNIRGNYGVNAKVYDVTHGSRRFALKAMINPFDQSDTAAIESMFAREYDIPWQWHPCLVPILHWFVDTCSHEQLPDWPQSLTDDGSPVRTEFLVMPLYDSALTTAARLRRDADNISEPWLLHALASMLRAVQFFVQHNVLHMDLKLDNVLVRHAASDMTYDSGVSPEFEVAITDYGTFVQVDNIAAVPLAVVQNREGNPLHRAPEFRSRERVLDLSRAEVWAVGVMAHELVSGASPFGDQSPHGYILGPQHDLPHAERWPLLVKLIRAMLHPSPHARINVNDAVLLTQALLYGAPIDNILTLSTEQATAEVEAWRNARVEALHRVHAQQPRGAPATPTIQWRAETEYVLSLEVAELIAATRRWL